eukprot:2314803-Amphidinium_carterae.1
MKLCLTKTFKPTRAVQIQADCSRANPSGLQCYLPWEFHWFSVGGSECENCQVGRFTQEKGKLDTCDL